MRIRENKDLLNSDWLLKLSANQIAVFGSDRNEYHSKVEFLTFLIRIYLRVKNEQLEELYMKLLKDGKKDMRCF